MATKTGIIYVRVSSDEQVEGTSLKSQDRLCREYAAQNEIKVDKVFEEPGFTAKTAARPQLNEAIQYCRRHHIDYFIFHKVDRFARDKYDYFMLKAMLQRSGTVLLSVSEPINDSPTGKLMEGMLASFAQFDNDVRSERASQGLMERVKQGVWVFPAPIGYKRLKKGGNLVPDPEKASLITFAFTEYAKGSYTFEQLAKRVAEIGLRTRHGCLPTHRTLSRIITNPIYAGIIRVWGEDFEGVFPPLVPKKLFAACQPENRRSAAPHAAPRSLNNPTFPLRGFITCAACQKSLTGSASRGSKGARYPYYHHYNRTCLEAKFIPKDVLEAAFLDYLDSYAIRPAAAARLRDAIKAEWTATVGRAEQHNAVVRKEITILEGERQRVFDLHRSGTYSNDDFLEQKRRIEERIRQKNLSLLDRDEIQFELDDALDACFSFLSKPAEFWVQLRSGFARQLRFQRLMFREGLTYEKGRLRTHSFSLVYRLKEEFQSGGGRLEPVLTESWNELIAELREWMDLSGPDPPAL
jgi:DNA invertase Pin-like site-specific DNA recombinase